MNFLLFSFSPMEAIELKLPEKKIHKDRIKAELQLLHVCLDIIL